MTTSHDAHELAPSHIPGWMPGADGSDPLFSAIIWLVVIVFLLLGVFYFKLHALPEQMAHTSNSSQLQLVSILALIALVTHNNIFWVAALVLAAIRVPDFLTPLENMAQSLRNIENEKK